MRNYRVVTIGLVALLAACSSPTAAAPGPQLAGTSWTVSAILGKATIAASPATMKFAADRVSGNTGCNSYSAGYVQASSGVTISQAVMTAMACLDPAVMTQETAFTTALGKVGGVRTSGTGLELLDAEQKVVFTLAPVLDLPLEGTAWQLSGIIAKEAVTSPVEGSEVTMQVADGNLTGKACNTFRGQVTVSGDTFKAGPLMSTKMACANPEEGRQEAIVLSVLQAAVSYAIEGSTLTLTATDGTGLVFRSA